MLGMVACRGLVVLVAVMTEAELLRRVLDLCHEHGILAFHDSDSRRSAGDKGFPDLVLVCQNHVVFVELKTEHGERSREQTIWHHRLMATGARSVLWRPSDLLNGTIEDYLIGL